MVIFVYASSTDFAQTFTDATEYSLVWIPIAMLVITTVNKNAKHTSFATWHLTTWLQYAQWLGLINVSINSELLLLFRKLQIALNGFQLITTQSNTSVPSRFSALNINSYFFINNTEKFLIIFFGCVFIWIILTVFGFCYENIKEIKNRVYVNLIVRAFLICYYDFVLFGFLQIEDLALSSTYGVINSIFAVVCVVSSLVLMVYFPVYIQNYLKESVEITNSSTLLQEFVCHNSYQGMYYLVFLTKRTVTAATLVFLQSYSLAQLFIIAAVLIAELFFLFKFRPYEYSIYTYITIGSEICQLIIVVCLSMYLMDLSSFAQDLIWWIIFFTFWIGTLLCVARFLVTFTKKPKNVPIHVAKVDNIIEIKNHSSISELNLEKPSEKVNQIEVENTRNEVSRKQGQIEYNLVKSSDKQLKSHTEKVNNLEKPESRDSENNVQNIKDQSKTIDLDNSASKLIKYQAAQSGIPYYSKLSSKYTRGLTQKF